MIDTITIRLSEEEFTIIDHQKFSPNTYHFFNIPYARMGSRGYIDAVNNPTKQDYLDGIYKPQLTLRKKFIKGKAEIYLYIQFSAPKIKYLNNFDEILPSDFEEIVTKLKHSLELMSVITNVEYLKRAIVTKIHFGKNIPLPEYTIPYSIIKEVAKVDLNLKYDLSEKDYRNSGDSIRFHTNNFEVILYDKKKDLQKAKLSEKRSIDKDNAIQLNLFEPISKIKNFEILRIEVRYNNNQKIKSVFKKELQLKDVFDEQISLKIIQETWNDIVTNYQLMGNVVNNIPAYFTNIVKNNPNINLKTLLTAYAFLDFSKTLGIREFRKVVEANYSKEVWYRLKHNISKLEISSIELKSFSFISYYLSNYIPLKLSDYMTNFS